MQCRVTRESNSTAELTLKWMNMVLYRIDLAVRRTAADKMCAVVRYYDISSKADRGEILSLWQKSSYRTPLTTKSNQSHTQRCTWNHFTQLNSSIMNMQNCIAMRATVVNLFIARTNFFVARATYVTLYSPAIVLLTSSVYYLSSQKAFCSFLRKNNI